MHSSLHRKHSIKRTNNCNHSTSQHQLTYNPLSFHDRNSPFNIHPHTFSIGYLPGAGRPGETAAHGQVPDGLARKQLLLRLLQLPIQLHRRKLRLKHSFSGVCTPATTSSQNLSTHSPTSNPPSLEHLPRQNTPQQTCENFVSFRTGTTLPPSFICPTATDPAIPSLTSLLNHPRTDSHRSYSNHEFFKHDLPDA